MNRPKICIVIILSLFAFWLFLSSCENDNPTKPKDDMKLAGTWAISKMSSEYEGETISYTKSQLDSMGFVWILKMEENGTMEQTTNISGPLLTFPGTWSTSAEKLSLTLTAHTGDVGTMVYEYAIDGNILKLSWELPAGTKFYAEFTKQ